MNDNGFGSFRIKSLPDRAWGIALPKIFTENWDSKRHLLELSWLTLVYRIDVQYEINVQVEKFLKNIKHADPNKAVQGGFFSQN